MAAEETCNHIVQKLIARDIVGAASILEEFEEENALSILTSMPTGLAVRVMTNLQITFAASLLEQMPDNFLQAILPKLPPALLTAFLMHVPEASRIRLRPFISGAIETQIRELLEYPQGSVGRVVTTDPFGHEKTGHRSGPEFEHYSDHGNRYFRVFRIPGFCRIVPEPTGLMSGIRQGRQIDAGGTACGDKLLHCVNIGVRKHVGV